LTCTEWIICPVGFAGGGLTEVVLIDFRQLVFPVA